MTNGLVIGANAQFLCRGSPKQPVWIAQFNTIQEGTTTNWQRTAYEGVSPRIVKGSVLEL